MGQNVTQKPTVFRMYGNQEIKNSSAVALTPEENINGDWYFDEEVSTMYYMGKYTIPVSNAFECNEIHDGTVPDELVLYFFAVSGKTGVSKRSVDPVTINRPVALQVMKCLYERCIVPPPSSLPPTDAPPEDMLLWSDFTSWEFDGEWWHAVENGETANTELPPDGADVIIDEGIKYTLYM